jgi:imidazolonepropionase-like amidohydrolase
MRRSNGLMAAAAIVTTLLSTGAHAQLGSPNPNWGAQGTFAITNARIVPVSGPAIERGTLVISGGRIAAVGASVTVPQGAQVIDGNGLSVYPGMMDAATSMGLSEIPQGATPTVDDAEVGSFNPNLVAYFAINPHSAHIGVTRVLGVTHVISSPSGGIVSGQSSMVYLGGWTHPQMTIRKSAGLVITLPRAGGGGFGFGGGGFGGAGGGNTPEAQRTRERQLDSLKALIADARAYDVAIRAAAADRTLPRVQPDVKLAAMVPYVRGELPVLMSADRAVDIRASLDFAQEQRLTPIIIGAREALAVADRLKQMKVPVVYTHVRALPGREDDAFDVNYAAPGQLAAAGVTLAISTGNDGAEVRDLPHIAGMAAAYGLSREDALRAVTVAVDRTASAAR